MCMIFESMTVSIVLNLDCNRIGDEGVGMILESLKKNPRVVKVELDFTGISLENTDMIVNTLKRNEWGSFWRDLL